MGNKFDADAVDDAICEGVRILYADCASCPCCEVCCKEESTDDESDPYCNLDVDFYKVAGLHCGPWWARCHDPDTAYDEYEVAPTD